MTKTVILVCKHTWYRIIISNLFEICTGNYPTPISNKKRLHHTLFLSHMHAQVCRFLDTLAVQAMLSGQCVRRAILLRSVSVCMYVCERERKEELVLNASAAAHCFPPPLFQSMQEHTHTVHTYVHTHTDKKGGGRESEGRGGIVNDDELG